MRLVFYLVAGFAAIAVAAQLLFEPHSPWLRTNSVLFRAEAAIGYLVGIFYSRRMANEYCRGSSMRSAWHWMTAGVASFFAYQLLDVLLELFPALRVTPAKDAWLIGVSVSLALLLAGMLGMRWTFRAAGLAPRMAWADWLIILAIVTLTAARVAHGLEPYPYLANAGALFRSIRGLGLLLVGAGAIVAFLLYRSTVEFGQGQFSRAIRGLIVFFTIHLLLYQLDWDPALWQTPFVDAVTDAIYYTLPWLLAVALANCWNVPLTAGAISARYQATQSISPGNLPSDSGTIPKFKPARAGPRLRGAPESEQLGK